MNFDDWYKAQDFHRNIVNQVNHDEIKKGIPKIKNKAKKVIPETTKSCDSCIYCQESGSIYYCMNSRSLFFRNLVDGTMSCGRFIAYRY